MHSKMYQRILAIFLIITLTFANPLLITKSFAASIFAGSGDTGSKSVEFTASFAADDDSRQSAISDVNNQDLAINLKVNVKDKGYIKNAKVQIVDNNYALKGTEEPDSKVVESTTGEETAKNVELETSFMDSDVLPVETSKVEQMVTTEAEVTVPEETASSETATSFVSEEVNSDVTTTETVPVVEQLEVPEENTSVVEPKVEEISTNEESQNVQENKSEEIVEEDETPITVLNDMVESIENNTITLKHIDGKSETKVNLPIKYVQEDYVNLNKIASESKVIFTGTYVNEKGNETELSKEVPMYLVWKDARDVEISSEITKYIPYSNGEKTGVILQTLIKLSDLTNKNTLPVKSTELTLKVPDFQGNKPGSINIASNSTMLTNGKTLDGVVFDDNNWAYDESANTITIKSENKEQSVVINRNKDVLKDESEQEIYENRYYSMAGTDEYTITYVYEDVALQENVSILANASAKVYTFSGEQDSDYQTETQASKEFKYELAGQKGTIVSYNIEETTEDFSKAYVYLNYNNTNNYEINVDSKEVINVSYKDIVTSMMVTDTNAYYVDKNGNQVSTNDFTYRFVQVSKENFDQILGENGSLKVLNANNELIAEVTKDTPANEQGQININLSDLKLNRITIQATNPVAEGNLVINTERTMTKSANSKAEYSNFATVNFESQMSATYSYVQSAVQVGKAVATTKLNDTQTKANIVLDRESLSTVVNNEDVEIRIELNNDKDTSDIYGESTFRITMPDYIESMDITNASMVYEEGLELKEVTATMVNDVVVIDITVSGKQEYLNSGVLTNGANIVLNANIKVDLFAPATEQEVKLDYTNSEATSYYNNGAAAAKVLYSAPAGVLTINTTKNYRGENSMVTSVRQGTMVDDIEIFAPAQKATMEIVVMNNNNNTVSDVSILGRIPFKGVKDIETGEELGTTTDTTLAGALVSDKNNRGAFNIYYSENPEATKILDDPENEWKDNITDYSKVKSFLIIPEDTNYAMSKAEVLRFTYEYIIPENLQHNESFYGTFMAYYTNNTDVAKIDERSEADKVGLTTGEGPEVALSLSANRESLKEFEEVKYTAVVENTGTDKTTNVRVNIPIPNYTEYVKGEADKDGVGVDVENNELVATISELEPKEKVEITLLVKAKALPLVTVDTEEIIEDYVESKVKAKVNAEHLQKELASNEVLITINKAELAAVLYTPEEMLELPAYMTEFIYEKPTVYEMYGSVRNLRTKDVNNVVAKINVPENFKYESAYVVEYEADGITTIENTSAAQYDESTRVVTYNIPKVIAEQNSQVVLKLTVGDLPEGKTKVTNTVQMSAKGENTEEYSSNELDCVLGIPSLVTSQTTTNKNTYVKEGEIIEYVFTVKNEGSVSARNVVLTDEIPDGLKVQNIEYTIDGGNKSNISSLNGKDVVINAELIPGSELVASVKALATNLGGVQEKTVTNSGTIAAMVVPESKTNAITHIVEADEENRIVYDEDNSSSTGTNRANSAVASTERSNANNILKTYRITGTAWLDSNRNGMRDSDEQLMSGVKASLINSDTGSIVKTNTTGNRGEYQFTGVENGNYMVLFDYDTVAYTTTMYKQDGIASDVNSDAIVTKIEQDGVKRNAAITDIIHVQDLSMSGIDIGLVNAQKFDLSLNKTVTKITTQSKAGTTTQEYNGQKLVQVPIAAKQVASTSVYVEYSITVTNEGDVAGFAKKVVDYIPEGMTYNSTLNPDWYTGSDGNLYTSKLAEVELKPGETRELKLVLEKQMTTENTGIASNQAEVAEDFNIYGISDYNSTPANKVQRENDISSADTVLTIKTGETLIYTSVIITSIILGAIVIFIAYTKIVLPNRKRGV